MVTLFVVILIIRKFPATSPFFALIVSFLTVSLRMASELLLSHMIPSRTNGCVWGAGRAVRSADRGASPGTRPEKGSLAFPTYVYPAAARIRVKPVSGVFSDAMNISCALSVIGSTALLFIRTTLYTQMAMVMPDMQTRRTRFIIVLF